MVASAEISSCLPSENEKRLFILQGAPILGKSLSVVFNYNDDTATFKFFFSKTKINIFIQNHFYFAGANYFLHTQLP